MFRNLTFFRFDTDLLGSRESFIANLDGATDEHKLKPVGPLELSSRGWMQYVSVADGLAIPYVLNEDVVLLTLGGEDKILPSSAVHAELAKRIKKLEEAYERKLSGDRKSVV